MAVFWGCDAVWSGISAATCRTNPPLSSMTMEAAGFSETYGTSTPLHCVTDLTDYNPQPFVRSQYFQSVEENRVPKGMAFVELV